MFCPKCGAENPANAKFCGSCGASIFIGKETPSQPTINFNEFSTTHPPVSKELKIGIIIASFFIPLIGIIMGWIYMTDSNPEKKKVGRLWLYIGITAAILSCFIVYGINSCYSASSYYY